MLKNDIPWFQSNHEAKVMDWIDTKLKERGINRQGESEQIKSTDMSQVLKISTSKGDVYFKEMAPISRYEVALSQHLSLRYPEQSARVIACDSNNGWLLMDDISGELLRKNPEKAFWKKALHGYAEIQRKESRNVETLLRMGVPDRRLCVLKKEIQKHLLAMCQTGLNEEETAQVMKLEPELLAMCDQLEELGIPASLEHGDLHSANIQWTGKHFVFFDWGDASVSHPFFSTRVFWNALDELISSEDEWLSMVQEFYPAYLEPWESLVSYEKLKAGLHLSDQLACIHRALSWFLYITPNRKNQADSYNKPAQWLQVLLEHRELVKK